MGSAGSRATPGLLRLATRGSPLARLQSELVAKDLQRRDPGLQVELVIVTTRGDLEANVPLDQIGGQGVFVTEVQTAVLEGRADLAVHSAKDLPPRDADGLALVSIPLRADPRDALAGHSLDSLPSGATVATGSARRRAQLANLRSDLTFVELRGNIETRLRRAEDGDVDVVVVAAAALERLDLLERASEILSTTVMLPQIGQGAIALECRSDDEHSRSIAASIDDERTHRAVRAERALLAAFGASCSLPVGGLGEIAGGLISLQGLVASADGRVLVRATHTGSDPETVGTELANRLMIDGGGASIEEAWSELPAAPS